jgi:hypothetical protein
MSVKTKLARQAVKTTAKHTAHGTASKFSRQPFRSTTLLSLGAVIGLVLGLAIGRRRSSSPDPIAQAPAPTSPAVNGSATEKPATSTGAAS